MVNYHTHQYSLRPTFYRSLIGCIESAPEAPAGAKPSVPETERLQPQLFPPSSLFTSALRARFFYQSLSYNSRSLLCFFLETPKLLCDFVLSSSNRCQSLCFDLAHQHVLQGIYPRPGLRRPRRLRFRRPDSCLRLVRYGVSESTISLNQYSEMPELTPLLATPPTQPTCLASAVATPRRSSPASPISVVMMRTRP